MNKIFDNVAKFALAVSALAGATASADAATLYFKNTANWSKVSCYAWNESKRAFGDFPGSEIKGTLNDGTYTVNVPDGMKYVIFSDGGTEQTPDQAIVDNAVYNNKGKYAENASVKTVYFKNTAGWNDVYAYTWDDQMHQDFGAFPGTKLTLRTHDGQYYKAFYLSGITASNINFSNGAGEQTPNCVLNENRIYNAGGDTGDTYGQVTPAPTPAPAPAEEATTIFFYNKHNWKKVFVYTWDAQDNKEFGEWPGRQVTSSTVDGKYFVVIPKGSTAKYVKFNNGEGAENPEGVIENRRIYDMNNHEYTYNGEIPEIKSISFKNDNNWSQVYVYTWDVENHKAFGEFPGCPIVNKDAKGNFVVEYPANILADNVIFSDGSNNNQTKGDALVENRIYSCGNTGDNVQFEAMEAEVAPASAIQSEIVEDGLTNVYSTSGVLLRENVQISNATNGLPQGIYIAKDLKGDYKSVYVK